MAHHRKSNRTNSTRLDVPSSPPAPISPTGTNKDTSIAKMLSEIREEMGRNTDTLKQYFSNQLTIFQQTVTKQLDELKENFREEIEKLVFETKATNERLDAVEKDIAELRAELENEKQARRTMSAQIEDLKEKLVSQDAYSRRENLVISGIPQNERENCMTKAKEFFKSVLLLNADVVENMPIQRCHRQRSKLSPAPIIVRFLNYSDRMIIWKARSNIKENRHAIWEDLPQEMVARRNQLKPILKKALSLNKRATLAGDKLIIEGKSYTVKTLNTLPNELDPAFIATRTVGDVTGFFSRQSPLSNFYDAPIEIHNRKYNHVEQYFQTEKALFAERPDVAARIRQTPDPALCKRLGDAVEVCQDLWLPVAIDKMTTAVRAKFQTNERAREFLINTGKNVIAEAGPCSTWGIGLKLSDGKIGDKNEWKGNNALGKILMTIRDELSNMSD